MNYLQLTQTLAESFNALADEVQSLIDHKTILEHKLRYAHEQYQYLADKYAPAVPEVSETLAKLQLPPSLRQSSLADKNLVPLPKKGQSDGQHQIAVFIREGRKVAQKLSGLVEMSASSKGDFSATTGTENMTSLSTVLEQDFTVEGRKGPLSCPFSVKSEAGPVVGPGEEDLGVENGAEVADPTPYNSADPICVAMYEENVAAPAPAAAANASSTAAKCPIRFMDKHSPEEIAHYVETHKHEIPRSHEVCVRRYQKNEEQIRKLDAKYGNLVNMIQDLSHLHKPMLPLPHGQELRDEEGVDRASTKRVENWANGVSSAGEAEDPDEAEADPPLDHVGVGGEDRESHFDRLPLKEVRVGESPSRPWGISVPVFESAGKGYQRHAYGHRAESPPPAPVRMPSPEASIVESMKAGKCPFDHTKFLAGNMGRAPPPAHGDMEEQDVKVEQQPYTPSKNRVPMPGSPPPRLRPTFVNPPPPAPVAAAATFPQEAGRDTPDAAAIPPQMVFNISGPVFIGYPMEQAMQFMQAYQPGGR